MTLLGPERAIVLFGAFITSAILLFANWRRVPTKGRFDHRIFGLAVAFEAVAIVIAINILIRTHQPTFILPAVAAIVGLHFIGMWKATDRPMYLVLCAALCGMGIISAIVSPPARMQLTGFGSGIALLLACVWQLSKSRVKGGAVVTWMADTPVGHDKGGQ